MKQSNLRTFFISDLHFGHKNIISYDKRPFFNLAEMDEEIIKRWNNKVLNNDEVYILGDLSFYSISKTEEILCRLNGTKHLIIGNHDEQIIKSSEITKHFVSVDYYREIQINRQKIVLSHYFIPLYNDHYSNAIMLHGHSHNTPEHYKELQIAEYLNDTGYANRIYNVGCMHWKYEPVTLDEILISN